MSLPESGRPGQRAEAIVRVLRSLYPEAACSLSFDEPWHLLVASILSAQCTDARVNQITPGLFQRYPGLADIAGASQDELEDLIRSCGLYRTKARNIILSARILMARHQGMVPADLDALTALPGIGRKIGNLLLGDIFRIPAIVVDTHCARISRRLGLTMHTDPVRIEQDLAAVLPEPDWIIYGHLMVLHGRALCRARRALCSRCPLNGLCTYPASAEAEREPGDS